MPVGAAGSQFISEGGFGHHNIHYNCYYACYPETPVSLRTREQNIHSHLRRNNSHILERNYISNLASFSCIFENIVGIKPPGDQIGRYPVGHDTCDYFVDIQERFKYARNSAPQSSQNNSGQESCQPRYDNRAVGIAKDMSHCQCSHGAHQVLTCCTYVE